MNISDLKNIQDIEVSTSAMRESLTQHNQPELLRALSMLSPGRVTRWCIHVVDATTRLGISKEEVDEFFNTAVAIDKSQTI